MIQMTEYDTSLVFCNGNLEIFIFSASWEITVMLNLLILNQKLWIKVSFESYAQGCLVFHFVFVFDL